jgi:hypothetical protein
MSCSSLVFYQLFAILSWNNWLSGFQKDLTYSGVVQRNSLSASYRNAIIAQYDFRQVYMRRYHDSVLDQEMLLRVIVQETETRRVVVTVYKTSQIKRYLKGA